MVLRYYHVYLAFLARYFWLLCWFFLAVLGWTYISSNKKFTLFGSYF